MRLLVITTLYPNAAAPEHGVFVENRLRAYLSSHDADVKVIAPIPWFPSKNSLFGRYARFATAPQREHRHGIEIRHPRYFLPPKIGMHWAPTTLTRVIGEEIEALSFEGWECDIIDAHYLYPDGVAAARIARRFDKPIVVTARGTDANYIPRFTGPRRRIVETARSADRLITVSNALKENLTALGIPREKISVLRNGVDLNTFRPLDRELIRAEMQLHGPVIASVGHLIDRKGHDRVIQSLAKIPRATLLIAGDGHRRARLQQVARDLGLAERVRFLGRVPHERLAQIYNAADVLALASSREGWPNVLLEAMACGTPCVATPAGGAREVISTQQAGAITADRTPGAIAEAINHVLASNGDRTAVRAFAQTRSWQETTDAMAQIFEELRGKAHVKQSLRKSPAPVLTRGRKSAPRLLVTVDTEEAFDWSQMDHFETRVPDPREVKRFQDVAAGIGARPLYFLTYPLLTDPWTTLFFKALKISGAADCGVHLHPWSTPPAFETGAYYSFQKNLPAEVYRAKLQALAGAYARAFGETAIAHRAGRYGISETDYALLSEVGIRLDFSPSAGFDFSSAGGPDFRRQSNDQSLVSGPDWRVGVTPVSGARAIERTRFFMNKPGLISQLLPTTTLRLSPEGADLDDLKALTRQLCARGAPILTFTLHSTSLTPGANPYAANEKAVNALLARSAAYLNWFVGDLGGQLVSLADVAKSFGFERAEPRSLNAPLSRRA
ncbi:MAG: glycosyltransferase [Pseudomonadota bacterium]